MRLCRELMRERSSEGRLASSGGVALLLRTSSLRRSERHSNRSLTRLWQMVGIRERGQMPLMNCQIVDALPHLQRYAQHLTRQRDEADDLVQDCVERAMLRSALFEQGTNLRAWMFTMMRNIFINGKRRQMVADRHVQTLKQYSPHAQQPTQFHSAVLARAHAAIRRLSDEEREAVIMLAVEQRSYEETTARNGKPTGTMKSRLSRPRTKLRKQVLAEESPELVNGDRRSGSAGTARAAPAR